MSNALSYVLKFHHSCHEEVSRQHEAQPCDKPAVAARRDPESGEPYPVCAHHARGDMVPLTELIKAVREGNGS